MMFQAVPARPDKPLKAAIIAAFLCLAVSSSPTPTHNKGVPIGVPSA